MSHFGKILCVATVAALLTPVAASAGGAGMEGLMKYCKADIERLCPGTEPGGGRLLKCLKEHKEEMSVGCAQALQKLKGQMGQ